MKELQIFNNEEFGEIRTLEIDNEPWFVAIDICYILGLTNPSMVISRLDEDERTKLNLGRQGETNIVNEYGLYNLILASRKPNAKKFKRWITHEVIPSIRKNGGYIAGQEDLTDSELMAKALLVAQNTINNKSKQLEEANKKIKADEGKVLFAECVEGSKNSILIGELAKILKQNGINIGQNRLFEWLRKNNYLSSRYGSDWNNPTQKAMNLGLFEIKKTTVVHSNGYKTISTTSKVTGKGQIYFINKFKDLINKT